ncbi:lysergyl peptide synthetase subunit 2 [Trichoderma arundinaceum]|uniref:Lysergyl peptide synthetase subunit 2 n=1 Tax=Trichoderma arundinaceum TaxID=490622 RepID=A0A395NG64_TRIAR|nr:lysergyl peptide synthetase subunit 2 [Trichoderma arundinaceum]
MQRHAKSTVSNNSIRNYALSEMAGLSLWKSHLEGYVPCNFPSLSIVSPGESRSASVAVPIGEDINARIQFFCHETGISVATVLRVAWGLVLRAYTGQDSVCFGDVSIAPSNTDATEWPISVDVRRARFNDTAMISKTLHATQSSSAEKLGAPEVPLPDAIRLSGMPGGSPLFNTCISFLSIEDVEHSYDGQYEIIVRCKVEDGETSIALDYQTSLLSETQAATTAHTIERVISGLIGDDGEIDRIDLLSDMEKSQMYEQNKCPPLREHRCIDTLIYERCLSQPTTPAVCAWDGNFSYSELDNISLSIAQHLASLGVGPDVFVPLCFDKSRWTVVSMLGVARAGGAFVLLDPSHPTERLRNICHKLSAKLIVASTKHAKLAASLALTVVDVGDGETTWCHSESAQTNSTHIPLTSGIPESALYAVFTSGSTGAPKGVISEHASFHAAISPYIEAVRLNQTSRVFQFSSYAFDVTIFDTLMTLISGGCVCVPSNTDRWSDVANAIQHFQATHLSLTPTVARILDPKDFPTLTTLVLGGEKVEISEMAKWLDHARVISLYGASECSIISLQSMTGTTSDLRTIHHATGSVSWIVDPNDHERLLPRGAIGELVIEGPIVGRGYLDDPEKTAVTFIQPPAWLRQLRGSSCYNAVYKSGDLIQCIADGSLRFIGRKDTQIKLRGQRIELGDVEHHVKVAFPGSKAVVAEVVTSVDPSRPSVLVAFIRYGADSGNLGRQADSSQVLAEPTHSFHSRIAVAQSRLEQVLPSYMIPSVFLPLASLPLTNTDKINRRLLRELVATLSREDLERYRPSTGANHAPKTTKEKLMRQYYARALNLPLEQIRADDNFFQRGGDSLTAMKLVAMARKDKHKITVQNVFDHPLLSALATVMQSGMGEDNDELLPAPFSLISTSKPRDIVRDAARQCQLPVRAIEDVYPCTPLQRGFMSETMRNPRAFITNLTLSLPLHIDLQRLQDAWIAVAKANPILRTRMVLSASHGLLQTVIREDIRWILSNETEPRDFIVGIGKPLVQLVLYSDQDNHQNGARLLFMMHHAVYDGWTLPLIFADVETAYGGNSPVSRPVSPFIRYLQSTSKGEDYWKSLMGNLQSSSFPNLPYKTYQPSPNATEDYNITITQTSTRQFTPNTYTRLAWAIAQAHHQTTRDVFFGIVVSGRNAPLAGIEAMTVPTVATVPCRVILDSQSLIWSALHKIQDDTIAGIAFEQFGLSDIRHLGESTALACSFQTVLVMTPALGSNTTSWLGQLESGIDYQSDATYAINLIYGFDGDRVTVKVVYDSYVIGRNEIQRLLADFDYILQTLYRNSDSLIQDVFILLENN